MADVLIHNSANSRRDASPVQGAPETQLMANPLAIRRLVSYAN
jgi:hypothetical protein